jgi:integrase
MNVMSETESGKQKRKYDPGLTVLGAKSAKPGRHADGKGLYLLVKPSGAKSWLLRTQYLGKRRDIGLGSYDTLSLAEAREKAAALRKVSIKGDDPIGERDKGKFVIPTFAKAMEAAHAEFSRGWVDKHAAAFKSSLEQHALPSLGKVRVDHIDASLIRDTLAPIWVEKPVMARKVRVRIGQVLDYAKAKRWRSEGAPAAKEVSMGLAKHGKGKNFAAMPHADVPAFLSQLETEAQTVGRLALKFTILTAARSGEVRHARWGQIDLEKGLWARPAAMMKAREAHTVALSPAALEVLRQAAGFRLTNADSLIFAGKGGKPLSDMTLTKALRDAGHSVTVHGFRAAFRNWAAEKMPTIPSEVAETALAHSIGNATTRAYLTTSFVDLRHKLMAAWGDYCTGRGNVIQLAATA